MCEPHRGAIPIRLIARKDDEIWTRISRFGTPWPPFDFRSGMGVRDIRRDEAERLGVLKQDEMVRSLADEYNFNEKLYLSLAGLSKDQVKQALKGFPVEVDVHWAKMKEVPPKPESGSDAEIRKWADTHLHPSQHNFSRNQIESLIDYQGAGYKDLNKRLREGLPLTPEQADHALNITQAVQSSKLPVAVTV